MYGVKNSKTKYVIVCNDDDFISNYGLNKGVDFLEQNKKYSSIQGEFIFFRKLSKLNLITFVEAYADTLIHNLDFKNKIGINRVRSIYLKRPHWYNALHYKKNLEISYNIASKGSDIHYSEIILPLIIGLKGYVKTAKYFWYAKDSNVYKNLSILDQKKRKKMLKEILSSKSLIRTEIDKFICKELNKQNSKKIEFNNIIREFFAKYLITKKESSYFLIIKKIKKIPYQIIPKLIKNLLRILINYIKNNSIENTSSIKNYGPNRNNSTLNDWLLMKLHVKAFNKKFNYERIYKNLE